MPSRPGSAKGRRASPPLLRFARFTLAALAIELAACQGDRSEPGLPWVGVKASSRGDKKVEAAEIPVDCDDLPALTPEELARPPRELRLERAAPAGSPGLQGYTVLPDVTLSNEAAAKLAQIDGAFSQKTGEHLVITSGTRDAARQAKAMYKLIELGGDTAHLYKNKRAAREIQGAYDATRGEPPEVIVAAMHEVIKAQMARGIYVSAHLRAGAVDVRNRTMTAPMRQAFLKTVTEVGGASLLEESRPPHYHLQIE
jgi:hypothetical protein